MIGLTFQKFQRYKGGGHKKAAGFTLPGNFKIEDLFDKETKRGKAKME
jgi:nanoRNase/pAp phosphatase (c-di-AMP/oligoRNAs hydrolase)